MIRRLAQVRLRLIDAVALAAIAVPLAMLGVGITFHYFTDTVGGLLLATAILCVAAVAAET